jgi:multidrug efflux pump
MDEYIMSLYQTVQDEVPETEAVITVTSPGFGASSSVNSGFMRVQLVEPDERNRSQAEIAQALTQAVGQMDGARTFVSQEQTIDVGNQGGQPIQYVLQAPNLQALEETLPDFMQRARQSEVFTFLDSNLKFNKPELNVNIDRERADNIGVSARDVAETLQLALSEQRVGFFTRDGQQRDVVAQVERSNRNEPADLMNLYVRSDSGEPVLLGNVVSVEEQANPPQLFRFNRFQSATISGQLAPGYSIDDGITELDRIAEDMLGPSFSTALDGASRDFQETSNQLLYVFGLALVLIYLVLAAQFESFRDPFTILITVPLALTGALAFLWVFGQSLNIFSQIGIVMLVGLVAKNGILIVEFANQRRAAGLNIEDAITEAAAVRFRPILMTAFSTILGVLPIALAVGAGAESRIPMGLVVIGGLIVGTFLSLYIIPAMYTYLTGSAPPKATAAATSGDGAASPGSGDGTGTLPNVPDPAASDSASDGNSAA